MAVSRVMMVEAADGLFGIPMDAIVETVRVSRNSIHTIKQAETFVLRNAIVPLIRLDDLLSLEGTRAATEEEAVVVARVGNRSVGLVIDRFREGIDVILKPLDGVLGGMRGFSGSALLGDGRILLVLNLKELL
jgi:two-component system chemotaxis sensor kinase CheA